MGKSSYAYFVKLRPLFLKIPAYPYEPPALVILLWKINFAYFLKLYHVNR